MRILLSICLISFIPFCLLTNPVDNYENPFFPVSSGNKLVFETSFGISNAKYTKKGDVIVAHNEGEKFKYIQELIVKDDGVYVKEVYQYFKIFLFISKEARYTYDKPMLRLPAQIKEGIKWDWSGTEYCDGDSSNIQLSGKVAGKETIVTENGALTTWRIETMIVSSAGKTEVIEWYSPGIGLIKTKIVLAGGGLTGLIRDFLGYGTIEFNLKRIEKN